MDGFSRILEKKLSELLCTRLYAFIDLVLGIFNFAIRGNIFTDRMKICLRDFVALAESWNPAVAAAPVRRRQFRHQMLRLGLLQSEIVYDEQESQLTLCPHQSINIKVKLRKLK